MKRVDRYVLRELSVPLIVGTAIVALLFVLNEFIAVFRFLQVSHIPPLAIVKLVLLRMPYWLTYTLPTGIALGSSLAVSRLVRESELTAMRAAGLSIHRVLLPIITVSALLGVASFLIIEKVVPVTQREHARLSSDMLILGSLPKFERDVMIKLPPYLATFGEVERLNDESLVIRDVLLIERPRPGEMRLTTAPQGDYNKGVWRIERGMVRMFVDETMVEMRSQREPTIINQRIDLRELIGAATPETETLAELWDRIELARRSGGRARELEVSFYERFSVPASCLVFGYMSILLALRFSKTSAFQGLLISMAAIGVYFNFHIISTLIIGKNGWLSPMLSAWLPVIVFGSIAALWGWKFR